ncbi:uncharacterized protein LOC143054862 [Mytilus galloprovincialis]|uniref:uncharacterized protein LOC143054862 n=1 Tax=Mytilus galloprovincialis TaxID=29158 RepID=UPI003F7B39A9
MSTSTRDIPDNSPDEVTRLSSLMDRLTNRVDNLENGNQRLNEENKKLKTTTLKLETLNKVFVQEQKKIKEDGAEEMKRLSSLMDRLTKKVDNLENENQRLNVENAELKITTTKLETMNTVFLQDLMKTKESIESKLLVGEATNAANMVGFTAVLTEDVKLGPLQTIVYDKVITNIGKGYDSNHGHFIAPVSGLYIISATSHSCNSEIWSEIVKNKVQLAAMYGYSYDFASHTLVVSLKQNDQVWVRTFRQSATAHAGRDRCYCSFSGVLIAAS